MTIQVENSKLPPERGTIPSETYNKRIEDILFRNGCGPIFENSIQARAKNGSQKWLSSSGRVIHIPENIDDPRVADMVLRQAGVRKLFSSEKLEMDW